MTGWMLPVGSTWRPNKGLIKYWLTGIENRGRDATGYFSFDEAQPEGRQYFWMKGPKTVKEFLPEIDHEETPVGRIGLMHTRSRTVGSEYFNKNNHPIVLGNTYVTHNGGFPEYKDVYKTLGVDEPVAEVDSAVIAHAISKLGPQAAMKLLVDEAPGFAAIVAYLGDHGGDVLIARDGRPLYFGRLPDNGLMWSSEADVCANTTADPTELGLLWTTTRCPSFKYMIFDGQTLKIKDAGGFMLKTPYAKYINQAHTSGLVPQDYMGFNGRASATQRRATAEKRIRLCEWGKCTDPGTKTVLDADGTQKLVCKPHKREWRRGVRVPGYDEA